MEKQVPAIRTKILSIIGVGPNTFHCFAELETTGKCLEWGKNNIGVETVDQPQNMGAAGAAMLTSMGMGKIEKHEKSRSSSL